MVDFDEMRDALARAERDKGHNPHVNDEEVLEYVFDWYGISTSLAKAIKMLIEQPHDIESYKKAINSLNRYERARDAR